MYKNDYDTSVMLWSPQGRIHQIEYAMEAVKQGSVCVGMRSKKLVVMAAIKRSPSELASHQQKLFRIDKHLGIGISGLTADARSLSKVMRMECLNHTYVYGSQLPVSRLAETVSNMAQDRTAGYGKRPLGVGMLLGGVDRSGPHMYYTCPSGQYLEYHAMAIGARSQSAKTYFEKHFESFADMDKDALIVHALQALQASIQGDKELTKENACVSVVGVGQDWEIIDDAAIQPFLDQVEVADADAGAAGAGAGDEEGKAMDETA
jgi:20S proteasome subunit alpha 6